MTAELDDVQVFCGDANEHQARVYVALDAPNPDGRLSLRGVVRGPFATSGETLPAQFTLRDLPGETPLAATVVTDPCFWTPLHPAVYHVDMELCEQNDRVASAQRRIAIRPLGAKGNNLLMQGRRFVARAVTTPVDSLSSDDHLQWFRESGAIAIVDELPEAIADKALDAGVRLLLDLRRSSSLGEALAPVNRWPAVIGAIVAPEAADALAVDQLVKRARGFMLLCDLSGDALPEQLPVWAELGWVSEPQLLASAAAPSYAVIAHSSSGSGDRDARRAEVDQLQARLASFGQFAGYASV